MTKSPHSSISAHHFKVFTYLLYKSKNISSDYRLHGTQNNWLDPTVLTQKLVWKNMQWEYQQKGRTFLAAKQALSTIKSQID